MIRVTSGLIATLLTAAAAAGCVDDYNSLAIVQNQIPEDDCTVPMTSGAAYLPHGQADVAVGGYTFTPLLQSALEGDNANPNAAVINLRNAVTTIQAVDNAASDALIEALGDAAAATRTISGPVQPGATASTYFPAIDDEQAKLIKNAFETDPRLMGVTKAEVVVKIVVKGDSRGNTIASAPYYYGITVCNGCSTPNLGTCAALPTGYAGKVIGNGCFSLGQDRVVECCTNDAMALVCPAVSTAP